MLEKIAQINSEQRLWSVDWHPSGKLIATVGESKKIKLWSCGQSNQWSLMQTIPTSHKKSLRCVRFNHSGNSLAVASFDSHISIYMKGQQGYEESQVLQGPENEVKCISWSPDDKHLASCSRDKIVWVWSFNSTAYEYQCDFALEGHKQDIKAVLWIDEYTLASSSYDNSIKIWEKNDDDFECAATLQAHSSIVWNIVYDRSNGTLFSVGEDKKILRWKRNQNGKFELKNTYEGIHGFAIFTIALLKRDWVVTGSSDNSVAVVRLGQDGKYDVGDRKYHEGDVNCVRVWGQEEMSLASVGDDEKMFIWRIKLE